MTEGLTMQQLAALCEAGPSIQLSQEPAGATCGYTRQVWWPPHASEDSQTDANRCREGRRGYARQWAHEWTQAGAVPQWPLLLGLKVLAGLYGTVFAGRCVMVRLTWSFWGVPTAPASLVGMLGAAAVLEATIMQADDITSPGPCGQVRCAR